MKLGSDQLGNIIIANDNYPMRAIAVLQKYILNSIDDETAKTDEDKGQGPGREDNETGSEELAREEKINDYSEHAGGTAEEDRGEVVNQLASFDFVESGQGKESDPAESSRDNDRQIDIEGNNKNDWPEASHCLFKAKIISRHPGEKKHQIIYGDEQAGKS